MKILKRLGAGLVALLLLAVIGLFLFDATVAVRLLGTPLGIAGAPQAQVAGGPVPALPVAPVDRRSIAADALEKVVAYGAETDSHAVLVWHNGALQLEHYYPGYDAKTVTSTQSMHKSVLALLVGVAIAQGKIGSVNDPAARYVPEWANDGRREITIRQMLQQSSGIDFPGFTGMVRMTVGRNLAATALNQRQLAPPGTQFDYTNINPEVLGLIIERVSGQSYAGYLSENLWRYVSDDDAVVNLDADDTRTPRTFCCLDTTARAWLRVGLLHLNGGKVGDRQVVPAAWLRDVETPSEHNPNYGYLTWLGTTYAENRRYNRKSQATAFQSAPFAVPGIVYFDGFGGQRVYVVPSKGLVIVRTGALAPGWDDAMLPNTIIGGLR